MHIITEETRAKMRAAQARNKAARLAAKAAAAESAPVPTETIADTPSASLSPSAPEQTFVADGDLVDIWERRQLHPGRIPERPIRLTIPGMHIRWINLFNTARYQRARYEQGWVPVLRSYLKDEHEIYGATFTAEGFVCKGEKQSEMLMMMPDAIYAKIRKAKIKAVQDSNKKIKDNLQAAGAAHFSDKYNTSKGEQMADTLNNMKGDISFGTEAVAPDDEDATRVAFGLKGE